MIDKKPPRFSKAPPSADSFDDDLDDVPDAVEDDVAPLDEIDAEAEAAAMLAAQKRNANLITYGGGAVALIVLVALGYPRFKHYFVTDQPAIVADVGTPVPQAARKNYFAGSDKTVPSPEPVDNSLASAQGTPALADNSVSASNDSAMQQAAPLVVPSTPGAQAVPAPSAAPSAGAPIADSASSVAPGPSPAANPAPASPPAGVSALVTPQNQTAATPAGTDMDARLGTLNDRLDKLTAAHEADQAQMQALQASLAGIQKQLAEVATVKPASQNTTVRMPHPHAAKEGARPAAWELRSATNEMALIGHPGQNDLKKIAPGDMVTGLGKITSIEEQDGTWVVHGTSGSIRQ